MKVLLTVASDVALTSNTHAVRDNSARRLSTGPNARCFAPSTKIPHTALAFISDSVNGWTGFDGLIKEHILCILFSVKRHDLHK